MIEPGTLEEAARLPVTLPGVPVLVKYLTLSFGVAVLGMFVLILVIHVQMARRRRRVAELRALWRKDILHYIAGDSELPSPELQQAAAREPLRFLQLLMTFGTLLQGSPFEGVARLISATPLLEWMRRVAVRRRDYRFAEVARAVALFRLHELREAMVGQMDSPREIHQVAAAYAVARLAHPDDIQVLARGITSLAENRRDLAFLILAAFAAERPDKFLEYVEQGAGDESPLHLLALEVTGSLKMREVAPVILSELRLARTPTLLSASILAAGRVRLIEAHELIHLYVSHPDERVRSASVWALGQLRHSEDAETIGELLADSSWSVRLNAATALLQFGTPGLETLKLVREHAQDRFAQDMAQRALTHNELGVPLQ